MRWQRGRACRGGSCPAALLESRDDRLRRAHALGEFALAEIGGGAQVIDELSEREVLFDPARVAAATGRRCFLMSSQRE